MMTRLLRIYESLMAHKLYSPPTAIIISIVQSRFIRKGQEQMMADYMMLELLEAGRI